MAKEVLTPEEQMLQNAHVQTENFFEKHSKMVVTAIVARIRATFEQGSGDALSSTVSFRAAER